MAGLQPNILRHKAGRSLPPCASRKNETELTEIDHIKLYPLDVTDQASIDNAAAQILNDFETVDVMLNNAGYGLAGPFEAATPAQIRRQFDTNVFGLMEVTRAFLSSAERVVSPEQGAHTQTLCAVMPEDELVNGAYNANGTVSEEAESAKRMDDAKKLYDYCDEVTRPFQG